MLPQCPDDCFFFERLLQILRGTAGGDVAVNIEDRSNKDGDRAGLRRGFQIFEDAPPGAFRQQQIEHNGVGLDAPRFLEAFFRRSGAFCADAEGIEIAAQ